MRGPGRQQAIMNREIAAMEGGGLEQRGLLGERSQDLVTERYCSPDPALSTRTHVVSA